MLMAAPAHDETDASPSSRNNPLLRWYVVHCYGGAEYHLHSVLAAKGFETIWPYVYVEVRRGEWRQSIRRSLFSGYIFVGLNTHQSLDQIKWLSGFRSVVRNNGMPVQLAPGEIAGIRRQAERARRQSDVRKTRMILVQVGDWVTVPDGPFKGIPVRIVAIDKHNRITASLGNVSVTFPQVALESVDASVQRNV